ncbi:hypothetical protein H0H87_003530 [Tephrocybe sp. NHM501043]|nr:hypothetical protein H0H87_003530 [Tephrocybe sp. NHM501043]
MSKAQDPPPAPSPWSSQHFSSVPASTESTGDFEQQRGQYGANQNTRTPPPGPTGAPSRTLERANIPIRAATYNTHDHDRNLSASTYPPHARSEDLNHSSSGSYPPLVSGSSPRPSPAFLASAGNSRPSTPGSGNHKLPSSSSHSIPLAHRTSSTSLTSAHSESSSQGRPPPTTMSSTSASLNNTNCSACSKPMQGPFVRALGTVFHLNCFKCMDCGDVVASKFFPIEGPDGQQQPLCERDYFRRLNLICAKCNMALRGSYITACNSYYEHEGDVYCHFHYSTRFATKCAGCNSAILKQFVEINRNARDECWHPECYMINKFWNVKVVSPRPTSSVDLENVPQEPAYVEEERRESPASLKEKQVRMEQQVYRIWTVLSAFEESSAACISDMLRQVSNGQYLDAIRMAERFILHVEVLFATIDDLEYFFARLNMKGMSHVREARMLCRKTVELFTLLSHTQETGSRRMGMTQELLALVTGLAHYLKILIRIALTGALKLEREQSVREAMGSFLDKLHLLAVQGANPAARRMNKGQNGELIPPNANGGNFGTQGVMYGFRSLAPENAGDSPFREGPTKVSSNNPPSDLCVKCNLTVEEDCVRLGTYQRWHSHCIQCAQCGKVAAVLVPKEPTPKDGDDKDGKEVTKDQAPKLSSARRPPANVGAFVYEVDSRRETTAFGDVPSVILCTDHAHGGCRGGFQPVQRLEQYAFLLNVALRRLYLLLKKQGVVPLSPVATGHDEPSGSDPYRNSADIMRMKSVHLDRKLSATARLPKRSTIVESPAGRSVHPSDVLQPQRQHEHHPIPQTAPYQQGQAGQVQYNGPSYPSPQQHSSPLIAQRPAPPYLIKLNDPGSSSGSPRPGISRGNTEVMIIDESAPNSPAEGNPPISNSKLDDGITLADIPQIMEAAQAREQQRSLPRESSIPYIAELSPMELAIVKHAAVLMLTRSPLRDQFDLDELLEMVETKKSGFWKTLFKNDKKNIKKKGVFGIPLDFLVEREGSDSMLGATREPLRVPSFIDDVISAMKQMDMSIEGIFRKNGNIRRLKDLTEAIDRDPSSVDLTQDNPVQLAALLKKFLRDLPDPLMTFKLHRLFIATQCMSKDFIHTLNRLMSCLALQTEAERTKYLHYVSLILPKSHRDTMEILFVFLKWVASFAHMDAETGSKMDLGNLATVICPSILYARGRDAIRDETFGGLRVITSLLEHQDEFFVVPEEFVAMLHDQEFFGNGLELPGKEFMKKCENYLKMRGANGRSQSTPVNGVNNGGPRYPSQNPGYPDRPAMGPSQSERTIRPPPTPSTSTYQQPSSYGSPPQVSMPPPPQSAPQVMQRIPQQEWSGPAPRPINPNASVRPSSYLGSSRPSPEPSTIHQNTAVRQQT